MEDNEGFVIIQGKKKKNQRLYIRQCGISCSNVVPKWNNGTVQLSPRQLSTAVFCAEYHFVS